PGTTPVAKPNCGVLSNLAYGRLCRGKTGNRHAERRAGNIVETCLFAEGDRSRITTMLAADAELQFLAGLSSAFGGDFQQFADTFEIKRHERVLFDHATALIRGQEGRRIIA